MNNFGNFLWKLFSATMVFLCHVGGESAFADNDIYEDPKIRDYFETDASASNKASVSSVPLCKTGTYLSACGNVSFGVNWLKGMTKNITYTTVNDDNKTITKRFNKTTPDYFSYTDPTAVNTNENVNMQNLRKFFDAKQPIEYVAKNTTSTNNVSSTTYSSASVAPEEYAEYKNYLLSNFCTDTRGNISGITCEKCPNDAYVEESTVKRDTYGNGKILFDTWNIHTIADCYMREFTDSTGSYIYVANNSGTGTTIASDCYYSYNVYGSNLFYK